MRRSTVRVPFTESSILRHQRMSTNTGETGEEALHGSPRQALALLFQRAATIVVRTDVLIVLTGAGWLADSGLAAYKDVAEVPAYTRLGKTCLDLCASEQLLGDDAIEVKYSQVRPFRKLRLLASPRFSR